MFGNTSHLFYCELWKSFPSTLLCSKYLQSNFEVPGPLRSLSLGLIPTVLIWKQNANSNFTLGHFILPCQVKNKRGMLQWTRDGFGLGVERNLTGFDRYHMSGYDEEGKEIYTYCYFLKVYFPLMYL